MNVGTSEIYEGYSVNGLTDIISKQKKIIDCLTKNC